VSRPFWRPCEENCFRRFPKIPNGGFLSALERELAEPNNSAVCIRFSPAVDEPADELRIVYSAPPLLSELRENVADAGKRFQASSRLARRRPVRPRLRSRAHLPPAFHPSKTDPFFLALDEVWFASAFGDNSAAASLVGLKSTLECLLFDKPIINDNANNALLTTVDGSTEQDEIAAWSDVAEKPVQPWDQTDVTRSPLWSQSIPNRTLLQAAYLRIRQKSPSEDRAPGLLLQVLHDGLERTFDAGLKLEAVAFEKARTAPSTKQRIYAQYELPQRAIKRASRVPAAFQKIGILGSGLMGTGIAYTAACAGLEVRLFDLDAEAIKRSLARMKSSPKGVH